MANCLVTTLKESLNNDALIGMESIRLTVKAIQNPTDNQRCLRLRATGNPITIIAKGNGGFSTSIGGAVVKELVLQPSGSTDLYFVNDNYYIEITNKNNIFEMQYLSAGMIYSDVLHCSYMSNIDTFALNLNGDIDVIKTMPKIRVFSSSKSGIFGDISVIENNVYLQYLYLSNNINITGNIAVIGKLPTIFAAELGGTQVGGSIDELVANLILSENPNQGIKVGDGDLWNRISLGGVPLTTTSGAFQCFVFWENNGAKIFVVNGTNKKYTTSNTQAIYCKGYTAEEVASKWSGFTVIRVDA